YRSLRERAAGSATDAAIGRAHHRDVNRIFDQLRDGLADYPAKGSTAVSREDQG
ncbi:MAG: hypothetical protein JWN96_558, partial [Mycobacterium sp.]|nr:hypothetical protein [Mycobacterium sp.]